VTRECRRRALGVRPRTSSGSLGVRRRTSSVDQARSIDRPCAIDRSIDRSTPPWVRDRSIDRSTDRPRSRARDWIIRAEKRARDDRAREGAASHANARHARVRRARPIDARARTRFRARFRSRFDSIAKRTCDRERASIRRRSIARATALGR